MQNHLYDKFVSVFVFEQFYWRFQFPYPNNVFFFALFGDIAVWL